MYPGADLINNHTLVLCNLKLKILVNIFMISKRITFNIGIFQRKYNNKLFKQELKDNFAEVDIDR